MNTAIEKPNFKEMPLSELKKYVKYGDRRDIAFEFGLSETYVGKCLNGKAQAQSEGYEAKLLRESIENRLREVAEANYDLAVAMPVRRKVQNRTKRISQEKLFDFDMLSLIRELPTDKLQVAFEAIQERMSVARGA
jgi:hypothetical protein